LFSLFLYWEHGKPGLFFCLSEAMPGDLTLVSTTASVLATHQVPAQVLTSAILSPVRVGLAIPIHGDNSCDCSCSVARVKILLT